MLLMLWNELVFRVIPSALNTALAMLPCAARSVNGHFGNCQSSKY